jgi:protocatechuate 3,4-dioxygenase beta subunit
MVDLQPQPIEEDNDDEQIGRVLSRREIGALFGGAGAALLAACSAAASSSPLSATATAAAQGAQAAEVAGVMTTNRTAVPACIVVPEVTEGPYYVAEDLVRPDIRSDPASGSVRDGALLTLSFNVSEIADSGCTPLPGATVEIWHCDAAGAYSDVSDPTFNTKGQKWLRGAQVTDENGVCTFTTIYPGWYRGRAVHIHFKVRPTENQVFTSQLFFDDALSDRVFTQAPYAAKGKRDMLNSRDSIYQSLLLLDTTQTDQGYAATFPLGINLATLGSGQSGGGFGGPSGARPGSPPPGR